jgi:conjugal transfer pilus assembly protein TraW
MRKLNTILIALFLGVASLSAKDLGTYGEVFEIIETDLIKVLMAKLNKLEADGTLKMHNQKALEGIKNQITEPKAVNGIVNTTAPKSFYYDPSITLNTDLMDNEGRVFYQKGSKINPLDVRGMTKPLIFIDGSNKAHVSKALQWLQSSPLAKVILVKGRPLALAAELDINVYFDQFGKITSKLGITQVPAIVTQKGDKLLIEEVLADA